MAILTNKEWVVHVLHALAWMVPGEFKIFSLDQPDKAAQWAASN